MENYNGEDKSMWGGTKRAEKGEWVWEKRGGKKFNNTGAETKQNSNTEKLYHRSGNKKQIGEDKKTNRSGTRRKPESAWKNFMTERTNFRIGVDKLSNRCGKSVSSNR